MGHNEYKLVALWTNNWEYSEVSTCVITQNLLLRAIPNCLGPLQRPFPHVL